MVDLLEMQKSFILKHLNKGDTAVDFTMGNGNDTAFLADVVGESGHVYAFDIQERAVLNTRERLAALGLEKRCTLICDSHSNAASYIKGKIKAGMFNLGYLPGGDKTLTTKRATTLDALVFAISALDSDGIIIIAVYPGHAEGEAEGEMLYSYLKELDRREICISLFKIINSPASPYFYIIEKK